MSAKKRKVKKTPASIRIAKPAYVPELRDTDETRNNFFKIGGTTIGSAAVGGTFGSFFSPAGTVIGVLLGGTVGAAVSAYDACGHYGDK